MKGTTIRRQVILPATPQAALLARAALNDVLPRALGARRDHARLVLSELVTNAVKYGTDQGQDVIRIVIEAEGEGLRVEIEQPRPAPDLRPVKPRQDDQDFGELGLHIVDELADDWGTEAGPPGHVWFEFLGGNRRKGPDHPWG